MNVFIDPFLGRFSGLFLEYIDKCCTIGEISVVKAIKAVWPFVLALLVSIVITMYVPILTNFIPNVLL